MRIKTHHLHECAILIYERLRYIMKVKKEDTNGSKLLTYSFPEKFCTVRLHLDKLGELAEPHVEATSPSAAMGQNFSG